MILLREVQEKDFPALEEFAKIPGFINLTGDAEEIQKKIKNSISAFKSESKPKWESKFIFVAEDQETKKIIGTSMVVGQHGTKDSPHFYFQVGTEEKYADSINTGFIHGILELKAETDGPSEIGGLVISPDFRNNEDRLGRQISFVRFLFVGLNRKRFKDEIIAELLPPLNKRGQSPLWEAIGRRFTNMDYWEADGLCQKNKEFIFSLFPEGKIYTTFLSAEARNAIGKVGDATSPVFHMLKKIGFKYRSQVDPFDGGPHLWGKIDEILPIQKIKKYKIHLATKMDIPAEDSDHSQTQQGLITSAKQSKGEFRAISVVVDPINKDSIKVWLPHSRVITGDILNQLRIEDQSEVFFMPYY